MSYVDGIDFKEATNALFKKQLSMYRTASIVLFALLSLCIMTLLLVITREHIEPFLVTVDKRTGEVALPTKLQVNNFTPSKNMVRHFSSQFMTNWASFNALNIKKPFYEVLSMSELPIKNQYKRMILKDNPESPVNTLGRNRYRTVKIHSISELSIDNTLDIRYSTSTKESASDNEIKRQEWRAVMKWKIDKKKHSLDELNDNPISFMVTYLDIQAVK